MRNVDLFPLLASALILPQAPGASAWDAQRAGPCPVDSATVGEAAPKTPEVSTDEVVDALRDGSATVFDVRPFNEFAMSHIPGAVNIPYEQN